MWRRPFALVCALLCACSGGGEPQTFEYYLETLPVFWSEVYPAGGETLYCGQPFGERKGPAINIEHVYPMSWVLKEEGCESRDHCRNVSPRFNRIEADMHNFYPARRDINKTRGSAPFGMVHDEHRDFGTCDFEFDRRRRMVEPRPAARGNIARAMFYMHETYGLKLFRRQGELLQRWNREDPPDTEERHRNAVIAELQGNRNRFIDDPTTADGLRF
jgi:deoxyribonuclease-1